ncbi:SAF domain-containing protein [uncultured Mycolicibacterium sp.]|uniref:SAF domain-containing protein n=1 Tax=uncultured Mycolicibacterium sp. TaxID=2320817 RepID=UPI00261F1DB8|nr:SAF domain-containing protein [uncultured Mycolicibacterium sp.]
MAHPLDPTPLARLRAALRPDWTRTLAARRAAAAGLVLLAAVAAVRGDPAADRVPVLVAARDLAPGVPLTAADVRVASLPAAAVPDGATADPATAAGAVPAGPVRRGEPLTDVRLLGTRLAESAAGPGARIVGLRPAEPALLAYVRPGDVVDVLAADPDGADPRPRVLATGAVVVLVSPDDGPEPAGRLVLVALPARTANDVAGAALGREITLTLR